MNLLAKKQIPSVRRLVNNAKTQAEVIREAFARLALEEADKPLTAMIGDRKHDIVGAKKNGIASVGVAFGYAEEGELEEAGADRIVASVSALRKLLLAW